MSFQFDILESSGDARVGCLKTPHGEIQTPAFMPVGTQGSVKSVSPDQLLSVSVEVVLANAYHLSLRPGADIVAELGGLHRFMGWKRPILTDSGGFQVFSLAAIRKVTDRGVEFRSHIDGSLKFLGPSEAIDIQEKLGADMIMVLDDCPPYPADPDRLRSSLERSMNWAKQCQESKTRDDQLLLGIVQGGTDLGLRSECVSRLTELNFGAYAIGGVAVGEGWDKIRTIVAHTAPLLPQDRVRYLMGVASPGELVHAISCGIDLFDCVLPTRNGRNGVAFTSEGRVRIRGQIHKTDPGPLDPNCDCPACVGYSRGYLRHLSKSGELLSGTLVSLHNISFFQKLVARARQAIREDKLPELLAWCDEKYPVSVPV